MPLEIRELVIKTHLNHNPPGNTTSTPGGWSQEERTRLIEDCVRAVTRSLKDNTER